MLTIVEVQAYVSFDEFSDDRNDSIAPYSLYAVRIWKREFLSVTEDGPRERTSSREVSDTMKRAWSYEC